LFADLSGLERRRSATHHQHNLRGLIMSNVLLVDTNFSSSPIYQFLRKAGHRVTVSSNQLRKLLS